MLLLVLHRKFRLQGPKVTKGERENKKNIGKYSDNGITSIYIKLSFKNQI